MSGDHQVAHCRGRGLFTQSPDGPLPASTRSHRQPRSTKLPRLRFNSFRSHSCEPCAKLPPFTENKPFRIRSELAKSFRAHSYEKCACKSFKAHSYKIEAFEVPSNHTLTKRGEW